MALKVAAEQYLRITAGVRDYLRQPLPVDPDSLIRAQLANREARWLDLVRRTVWESPANPYRPMFELAGCDFGDLCLEVKRTGLENTLCRLRSSGVFLTHQELKGKEPIVRAGKLIASDKNSFNNPWIKSGMIAASSGSRSEGTQTVVGAGSRIHSDSYYALNIREFDLRKRAQIQVKPVLPASAGLSGVLASTRLGCAPVRWFAFGGPVKDSWYFRILTHLLIIMARVHRVKAPFPVHLPANDFSPVANFIAQLRAGNQLSAVGSFASPAVRVAAAAKERGLDIRDTLFLVSGEPLTEGKRQVIESTGARVFSRYHIAEVGPVGYGCSRMTTGNSVHLFEDSIAVVSHRQKAPLTDVEVDALLFTTLLPEAPKVLINADMDDVGRIEPADCDCVYSRLGLGRKISGIHSIGKLTGHGMSLVGTEVVRLLEQRLPTRFGGAPTDYQLVELEGEVQTQLILRVSPRLAGVPLDEIRAALLKELRTCYAGRLASRVWSNADALQVIHAQPLATVSGKVLPLHLMTVTESGTHAT